MNLKTNLEEWRQIIAISEQIFIPPILENASKYILDARNKEGDWGYYKDIPTDLHVSSLAIEALQLLHGNNLIETCVEDATARVKHAITQNINTAGIQQLVDLLNITPTSKIRDLKLEQDVVNRLNVLRHNEGWGTPEISISNSCIVILSLIKLDNPPQDIIGNWIKFLIKNQNQENGGWGAVPESESNIIPTSHALRLLNHFSDEQVSNGRFKAIEFVKSYLLSNDLDKLDTFTLSTILRVLGELTDFPLEIIQAVVESLYTRINSDGGWGPINGEVSNVEQTALAMIALSSAGETKFVSSRLVKATIDLVEAEKMNLEYELSKLEGNVDTLVQNQIKNIILERNNLQIQVNTQEKNARNFQGTIDELECENIKITCELNKKLVEMNELELKYMDLENKSKMKSLEFQRLSLILFALALITTAISVLFEPYITEYLRTSILVEMLSSYTTMIPIVIFILVWIYLVRELGSIYDFIVPIFGKLFNRTKTKIISRYEDDDSINFYLVAQLSRVLSTWTPDIREDFLYQLSRTKNIDEIEKLNEVSQYLSERYGQNEMQRYKLRDILYIYSGLPVSARIEVIDYLREKSVPI